MHSADFKMHFLTVISNFFLLAYFVVSCRANSNKSVIDQPPTIKYVYIADKWKNITSGDDMLFYDDSGEDFDIACEAPYPIRWNISGIIAPAEMVKIRPPTRNLVKETFEITLGIYFLDAEGYSELVASADIICESVDDPTIQKKTSLFVTGVSNKPTLVPRKTNVTDSNLIPCYTTDPTTPTMLFLSLPNGNERLLDNVYNPTEGFYSSEVFKGNYICRKGSQQVMITAVVSDQFSPLSNSLTAFAEDVITFRCSSKTNSVKLRFDDSNDNVTVTFVHQREDLQEAKVTSVFLESGSEDTIKGKVACIMQDRTRQVLVKAWTYEFIALPELYLDNFEREAQCISGYTPRQIQTVRCRNSIDCQFMTSCFPNMTDCNFKKQKQFYANTPTVCYIDSLGRGKGCASIPYSHLNGVAQCRVMNGLTKSWEVFVSLDFLRYSYWKDAPLRELVRMDETPGVLYTNISTEFYCTAVAYLFADSLTFELEYKNGSRFILEDNNDTVRVSKSDFRDPRKIDEFNVLSRLNIFLPIDAVAVYCNAPWWNSTDVMVTSRKFETRHLLFPTIEHGSGDSKESFYTEEKNRRLTCFAQGEPQPTYKWLYNRDGFKNALEIFPELKTSLGSNGEGYLEFPTATAKYSGEYKCVAENVNGKVEKKFSLDVSDEPVSGKSVFYIITVLIILMILFIVLGVLFIFMRRYKKAKELVRSLTDNEIDEFFRGKPELLSNANGQGQSAEVIDFLPYKSEYEIPIDDLEFDQSEKNFLGSGEFSYVVKGMIISKSKPVAVKISKPTADVTLFKSLLSEVKIMIYIEGHDHVVTLIGVCTQSIRERCIHIATEICELGSLDKFLRKARPVFTNLIDANQQIDKSLLPAEGTPEASTLDLINFSAQIAKGMEYLAFKFVIHADLATRNVLLTSQKVCKISDFGLSKKLYECNNYVKKSKSPLPWRWMPPESLTTLTFSTHSDVWSYGATLYEIFTLGDIPFPNEEWNKEFLSRLANGMRMGRPKYSTADIYSKIVVCWEHEPEHRPSFSTLRSDFEGMMVQYGVTPPPPSDGVVPAPANNTEAKSNNQNQPTTPTPVIRENSQSQSEQECLYANCDEIPGLQVNYAGSSPNYMNVEEPPEKPFYMNQPTSVTPNYTNVDEK